MSLFRMLTFGSDPVKQTVVSEPILEAAGVSQKALIEKIHSEFDTAPERLIQSARDIVEAAQLLPEVASPLPEGVEEKGARLMKLGFTKAIESISVQKKQAELEEIKKQNQKIEQTRKQAIEFAELVLYYQRTYPFTKFLSTAELDRICQTYGLIYAPVNRYIKTVPDKNIAEMENAQEVKVEDVEDDLFFTRSIRGFMSRAFGSRMWGGESEFESGERIVHQDVLYKIKANGGPVFSGKTRSELIEFVKKNTKFYSHPKGNELHNEYALEFGYKEVQIVEDSPFHIAAPKDHFDLTGYSQSSKFGYTKTIVKEDPIVFQKVRGGVLVVTKWGLEASDPSLINPVNN